MTLRRAETQQRVTNLELCFDLVFVSEEARQVIPRRGRPPRDPVS